MLIVYGAAGLTLAVLLYAIVLIGCRNPRKPAWTHDFLVGNIYVPAMIVLCVLGLGCLFSFLVSIGRQSVDWIEVALAAGVAAGGLVLLKALGLKKRLADYAAGAVSGEVIQLGDVRAAQPPNNSPSTHPVKPTAGQRAA